MPTRHDVGADVNRTPADMLDGAIWALYDNVVGESWTSIKMRGLTQGHDGRDFGVRRPWFTPSTLELVAKS